MGRPWLPQCQVRDLAARLDDLIDGTLTTCRRLCGQETWLGPTARALEDDLHAMHHRLLTAAEDSRWHDRRHRDVLL